MLDNLRPCPFCRGTALLGLPDISAGGVAVFCTSCRSQGPRAWEEATAIAAWNKRAEAETAQADLNALLDALNSDTVEGALEWADQLWVWVDEWNKQSDSQGTGTQVNGVRVNMAPYQHVNTMGQISTWTLLPKKP